VKVWSGKWSLHSCSQFGGEWTDGNRISGDSAYGLVVYTHRKGISDCWVSQAEKDNLGDRLVTQINGDSHNAKKLADSLKEHAERVLLFFKQNEDKKLDAKIYEEFWKNIADYYIPHLSVKYIVDYLSPEGLEKYLPIFEEARLYSEPVFREQENFMERIAEQVGKEKGIAKELVLSTTKEEFRAYFKSAFLPDKSVLEERFGQSIQFFESGKSLLFSGLQVSEMEKIVLPKVGIKEIKGQIAYKGNVRGIVRLVIDPFKYNAPFEKGDILVTGMTRPEFLPLMEKAAAFVTDAGGILSHAAIVAREMKKPCVIGTGVATKILKDGDTVEVDADKGIVRIIR